MSCGVVGRGVSVTADSQLVSSLRLGSRPPSGVDSATGTAVGTTLCDNEHLSLLFGLSIQPTRVDVSVQEECLQQLAEAARRRFVMSDEHDRHKQRFAYRRERLGRAHGAIRAGCRVDSQYPGGNSQVDSSAPSPVIYPFTTRAASTQPPPNTTAHCLLLPR